MSEALRLLERGHAGKEPLTPPEAVGKARRLGLAPYRCLVDATHWHVGHVMSLDGLEQLALALRVRAGNGPATVTDVRTTRRRERETV